MSRSQALCPELPPGPGFLGRIRGMFDSLKIRYKILVSFSLIFFISMLLCNLFIYVYVRKSIENRIESELNNTTRMIYSMLDASLTAATQNYLRAVAEKNLDILKDIYGQARAGQMSQDQARTQAARIMLSQTIGSSGYLYCLDSRGTVTVHPKTALIGTNVAEYGFVGQMTARRQGYLEYDWKNPGEESPRPKALYMAYFEPWDWIVSVSAYRSEFVKLVNVADFRKSILSLHFGESGYAFVIDRDGKAIIHPKLQGVNIFDDKELPDQYLADMMARKKGKSVYYWKNPGEAQARPKLVIFDSIPEYQWIVASSSYLDELYQPLSTIRNVIGGISVFFFLILLATTFGISHTITTPLHELMARFTTVGAGDYSARMQSRSRDEVGELAQYFNRFMDQLQTSRQHLEDQIRVSRVAEQARKESQERYFLLMEAAPDPIVNYDMEGRVIYINPAFTRVFGWTFEACAGKRMDHFVPETHWPETRVMIRQVKTGDGIFNVETRRFDRDGNLVDVSISGATARDSQGNPVGSIIILRDITRAKLLEKQLMQAGDRVRLSIGQDLHDDLCPHLIGVSGLAAVLSQDLLQRQDPSAGLAQKMGLLMAEAVDKARHLARGLCPVHLVAHGLQAALEDMVAGLGFHPGIRFHCEADPMIRIPDNSQATHLFHIAREAVNNAVKHSGADLIRVCLQQEADESGQSRVLLAVTDNGRGMTQTDGGPGIGLQIMAYRARIIDGQFQIQTSETGTQIHVRVAGPKETP